MKKTVVEINAASAYSTGNITMMIAQTAREQGIEVYTFTPRYRKSKIKNEYHELIGYFPEIFLNRYFTWITDLQDYGGVLGTRKLVRRLREIDPDIIHLHDIVGYYINIDILFDYLRDSKKPVIWTFHDCWAFTGRCIYYDFVNCSRWQEGCGDCPQIEAYPASWFFDRSAKNFKRKKKNFCSIEDMIIITPSEWLKREVSKSFLSGYECRVINNGINLDIFRPRPSDFREKYGIKDKKMVLGVASLWAQPRKGLEYLIELSKILGEEYRFVIVGIMNEKIPDDFIGIKRTQSAELLAEIYTAADVFVDPTLEENFPTTHMEALACGTPIITFNTGGAVETVDEGTGIVVEQRDVLGLKNAVEKICENREMYTDKCLKKAQNYSSSLKYNEYVDLYNEVFERTVSK